uniref:Arrestin_N domain-containing protein n=1 Tax=Steinernema glaseri TaxID=37863 RepID=A0A1I8ARD7_9BILA
MYRRALVGSSSSAPPTRYRKPIIRIGDIIIDTSRFTVHIRSLNIELSGDAMIYPGPEPHPAKGQIFGRIEVRAKWRLWLIDWLLQISLLYLNADRELVVTVHQAMDLPPRPDGSARNPYVKLFLLPDR